MYNICPAVLPEYGDASHYTHSENYYHLWLANFAGGYDDYTFKIKSDLDKDYLGYAIKIPRGQPVYFHVCSTNDNLQNLHVKCLSSDDSTKCYEETISLDPHQSTCRQLFGK